MAILHRFPEGWTVVSASGGAMGPSECFQVGMPRALWPKLLTYTQVSSDLGTKPEWTFMTQKKAMTAEDLGGYTPWQLRLMINEIYAVHGRPFKDAELRSYFQQRPWYRARADYNDDSLSPLEKRNAWFIRTHLASH